MWFYVNTHVLKCEADNFVTFSQGYSAVASGNRPSNAEPSWAISKRTKAIALQVPVLWPHAIAQAKLSQVEPSWAKLSQAVQGSAKLKYYKLPKNLKHKAKNSKLPFDIHIEFEIFKIGP